MKTRVLTTLTLIALLILSCSISGASSSQTVVALSDTYVEAQSGDYAFGYEPYLKVSGSPAITVSLAFLMFNLSGISYNFNASSEIKLRLHCLNVTSPHTIDIRWCLNNTWGESNLTFGNFGDFVRSDYVESVVTVSSGDTWYEWIITQTVYAAISGKDDRLTLVLEVSSSHTGNEYAYFYSRDAPSIYGYSPQLVFSYSKSTTNPLDITTMVIESVLVVGIVVGVVFIGYIFSRKRRREKYYRKSRLHRKSVRGKR